MDDKRREIKGKGRTGGGLKGERMKGYNLCVSGHITSPVMHIAYVSQSHSVGIDQIQQKISIWD